MMKISLLIILLITGVFSQELEVEGDLKVTGTVESVTIDSLEQMLAQQQILIDSLMGSGGINFLSIETEVYNGEIPVDWTDLDLSSVVGQKKSLVV